MANYQIKLTPVDTYFFGGEKHTINDTGELEANYFVESKSYPQQTTILGLLRYYLLTNNPTVFNGKSIIPSQKSKAEELIGKSSFNFNTPPANYGKIISLSPLYFVHKNDAYFFSPFDVDFDMQSDFQLSKTAKNYNAKDHYFVISAQKIVNASGQRVELKQIVSVAQQVGNEKSDKGETKDNKFYKMFSKRLAEGWSFCVDADLKDGSGINDGDFVLLPFGGEKSYFRIEVKKQYKTFVNLPLNYKRNTPYIFCESDCFVDASVLSDADFAVNNYVSFRNLQSNVQKTSKYSGLSSADKDQVIRGDRFNLLQRGSVLYFNTKEKLYNSISKFNKPHCETIGFNKIFTKS